MPIFMPTAAARRVTDLTCDDLRALGVQALLLDVDNTLSLPDDPTPAPGTRAWADAMTQAGFAVVIVSNNRRERVLAFAGQYGLPCCWRACKPLPLGYMRAARQAGVAFRRCAVVGDQIFTDIVGANLLGMRSVLLAPMTMESGWSFRLRRRLERPFRRKLKLLHEERGN